METVADDSDIINKLASYIIRLDNPRFAASGVRFLFVGVVTDMRKLLGGSSRAETISNRVYELPEIRRLSRYEAETVFRTGFFKELKLDFGNNEDTIVQSCVCYSGQNAQHVHEIGLNVAFEAEKHEWKIRDWKTASKAILDWAESSLTGHAPMVRARLNRFETRVQRKNQVLYCIAKRADDEFTASEVDKFVREEFSHTAAAERLGVDQILKGLAQGDQPLLTKDNGTNRFRLRHPQLRIAIRYVLRKTDEGNIEENRTLDQPYFY